MKYEDLIGPAITKSITTIQHNKKMYGLLVWHDTTTFNASVKPAFSKGIRAYFQHNPRYIVQLCDLPAKMRQIGLITPEQEQKAFDYLKNNPIFAIKARSATAQSSLNGNAAVNTISIMSTLVELKHIPQVKFGIDIKGDRYKWDLTIYNDNIELWLEIKCQNLPGSAEHKLISNHESIKLIGSQYFAN